MLDKKSPSKDFGEMFMLFLPIAYIVLGALLLFVPQMNTVVMAQMLGALMILVGAALVIRYFIRRSYLDTGAYGFSVGAFAAVLGICCIIRSDAVGESLTVFLDLCIMLTAIIKLQNAIQLFAMKSKFWIPVLVISLLFIGCTVVIAINPFGDEAVQATFTHIVLLCDGVASFANTILLRVLNRKRVKVAATPAIVEEQ